MEKRTKSSREIQFIDRTLSNGLMEIYRSSCFLALGTFLLIILISSVIPFSILWLIFNFLLNISIIPEQYQYSRSIITLWSLCEVLFLLYQGYLYCRIQRQSKPPPMTSIERDQLVSNALSNMKNVRQTLSKWFLDRPFHNIDRDSIISWLAFAFYAKDPGELTDHENEEILSLMNKIELDHQLETTNKQSDCQVYHMKHILDPVRVIFRPLVFYLVTDTLLNSILLRSVFYWREYEYRQIGDLRFWTYRNELLNDKDEEEPIIFFHGIGAGLLMYQPFFARIHHQFSRTHRIIFISLRCICMRYPSLDDIPNMTETVDSIHQIFRYYRFRKAIFIGHSYGTACLSWIVQKCPNYISKLIFIDPICFALFEPYVVYNFVYRIPYKLGHLYMYYFVCRELGISYVISRHFWWTQNNLFIEQIPLDNEGRRLPTYVLLSGRDCIVNVDLVKDYLIENQVQYYWAPKLSHGGFMHDKDSWEEICQWIS